MNYPREDVVIRINRAPRVSGRGPAANRPTNCRSCPLRQATGRGHPPAGSGVRSPSPEPPLPSKPLLPRRAGFAYLSAHLRCSIVHSQDHLFEFLLPEVAGSGWRIHDKRTALVLLTSQTVWVPKKCSSLPSHACCFCSSRAANA